MHTPYDLYHDPTMDDHAGPFAELRTFPGGWDLSDQSLGNHNGRPAAADQGAQSRAAEGEVPTPSNGTWQPEKFVEPRTIPAGWDTSALK